LQPLQGEQSAFDGLWGLRWKGVVELVCSVFNFLINTFNWISIAERFVEHLQIEKMEGTVKSCGAIDENDGVLTSRFCRSSSRKNSVIVIFRWEYSPACRILFVSGRTAPTSQCRLPSRKKWLHQVPLDPASSRRVVPVAAEKSLLVQLPVVTLRAVLR